MDLAKHQRDQLMDSIGEFAEEMSMGTGVPLLTCTEYVLIMLTTEDIERHCAACGEIHTNQTALSWYNHGETRTAILWSACEDCAGTEKAQTESVATLEAWAKGDEEPEGLVVIISPPKTPEEGAS